MQPLLLLGYLLPRRFANAQRPEGIHARINPTIAFPKLVRYSLKFLSQSGRKIKEIDVVALQHSSQRKMGSSPTTSFSKAVGFDSLDLNTPH